MTLFGVEGLVVDSYSQYAEGTPHYGLGWLRLRYTNVIYSYREIIFLTSVIYFWALLHRNKTKHSEKIDNEFLARFQEVRVYCTFLQRTLGEALNWKKCFTI